MKGFEKFQTCSQSQYLEFNTNLPNNFMWHTIDPLKQYVAISKLIYIGSSSRRYTELVVLECLVLFLDGQTCV